MDDLLDRLLDQPVPATFGPDLYRRLLEHTSDTISLFDLKFRYIYVNPVFTRLTGIANEDVIGKTDAELGMPEHLVKHWKQAWQKVIDNGEEQTVTFDYPTSRGVRYYESRLTPIFGANRAVQYLLSITRDITAHLQIQAQLRQSQEIGQVGTWEFDLTSQRLIWSDQIFSIVGIQLDDPQPTIEEYEAFIHPDDLSYCRDALRSAVESGRSGELEFRGQRPDGQQRHYHAQMIPQINAEGQVTHVHGTLMDITEQKLAKETLRDSEARYKLLTEMMSDYVATGGDRGKRHHFSRVDRRPLY